MTFSLSEVGLVGLTFLVIGITIGFAWCDRRWTRHRDESNGILYNGDPCTDGHLPLMCREEMVFGHRFCELPQGHTGARHCRATGHPHGANSEVIHA